MHDSLPLRTALDSVNEAVLVAQAMTECTAEVTFLNRAFSDFIGADSDQHASKVLESVLPVLNWLRVSHPDVASVRFQSLIRHAAGHIIPVTCRLRRVEDLAGTESIVLVLREIEFSWEPQITGLPIASMEKPVELDLTTTRVAAFQDDARRRDVELATATGSEVELSRAGYHDALEPSLSYQKAEELLRRTGGPSLLMVPPEAREELNESMILFAGSVWIDHQVVAMVLMPIRGLGSLDDVSTESAWAYPLAGDLPAGSCFADARQLGGNWSRGPSADSAEARSHRRTVQLVRPIADLGLWTADCKSDRFCCSSQVYRVIGETPADFAGTLTAFLDHVHPEDKNFVREEIAKSLDHRLSVKFKHRILRPDGHVRWVQETLEPIPFRDSQPKAVSGTMVDITDPEFLEHAIRDERDLVEALTGVSDLHIGSWLCLTLAVQISGMESGGVYLFDPTTGGLDLLCHKNLSADFVKLVEHIKADDPRVSVLDSGKPVFLEDLAGMFAQDSIEVRERLESLAVLPMYFQEDVVGAINLASRSSRRIDDSQRAALATISRLAGATIGRIRLVESGRRLDQKLTMISEALSAGVLLMNSRREVVWANIRARDYFSCDPVGTTCAHLLGCGRSESFDCLVLQTLQNGTSSEKVLKLQRKGHSTELIVRCRTSVAGRTESGAPNLVAVLLEDVTELVQLNEQAALLTTVARESIAGIAVCDREGHIVYVNKAFAMMHDYTPGELLGKHLSIFHSPDQMPQVEAINSHLFADNFFRGEVLHIRRDGTPFVTLMNNSVLKDSSGQVTHLIATMTDISDLKETEATLRRNQRVLGEAEEIAKLGWWRYDIRSGKYAASETAFAIHDLAYSDDADWSMVRKRIHPDDRDSVLSARSTWQTGSGAADHRYRIIRRDGVTRYLYTKLGEVVCDADGMPLMLSGVVQDVTEQVIAEGALRLQRDLASDLSSAGSLETVFSQGLTVAMNLASVECGAIYLIDGATGSLDLSMQKGFAPPFLDDIRRYGPGSAITCLMLQSHSIFGSAAELPLPEQERGIFQGFGNVAFLPMLNCGKCIGFLKLATVYDDRLSSPVRDALETVAALIAGAIVRLERERALQMSEERYRLTFEEGPLAGGLCDLNGNIMHVNKRCQELFGYTAEEFTKLNFADFTAPHTLEKELPLFQSLVRGEIPSYTIEKQELRKDGTLLDTRATVSLVRSAEGLPLHLLTVVEDLREQRDAERRLAEAQSWFAFAFQEGPLGIGFVSRDRRIRMANPALCRILGYSEQELSTIVASDLTAPEDMAADREFWRSFSEGPAEIRIVEKRVLHKDGHLVPVRLIVTPICDANGDLQYAMGLVEDLTRQKQAEEVVRRSDRLTAIGTLAAGIAHEINNPVAAALAAAETAVAVRGDPREAGTVDTCLQQIIGSLVRCGGIVRSILLFARDGVSEKRPGDLRKVTSRVLELTGDYAARLRVDINYTAPEFAIHASFNPLEIELMLTNLLRNAIEASPAGSSVALRLTQVSEGAEFLVQDSGSGMDDAQRTRFLDPFFSTRVNEGGTGLGASIAYGIIRAHEGRLEMESKPGIGTSIRVFLPA